MGFVMVLVMMILWRVGFDGWLLVIGRSVVVGKARAGVLDDVCGCGEDVSPGVAGFALTVLGLLCA